MWTHRPVQELSSRQPRHPLHPLPPPPKPTNSPPSKGYPAVVLVKSGKPKDSEKEKGEKDKGKGKAKENTDEDGASFRKKSKKWKGKEKAKDSGGTGSGFFSSSTGERVRSPSNASSSTYGINSSASASTATFGTMSSSNTNFTMTTSSSSSVWSGESENMRDEGSHSHDSHTGSYSRGGGHSMGQSNSRNRDASVSSLDVPLRLDPIAPPSTQPPLGFYGRRPSVPSSATSPESAMSNFQLSPIGHAQHFGGGDEELPPYIPVSGVSTPSIAKSDTIESYQDYFNTLTHARQPGQNQQPPRMGHQRSSSRSGSNGLRGFGPRPRTASGSALETSTNPSAGVPPPELARIDLQSSPSPPPLTPSSSSGPTSPEVITRPSPLEFTPTANPPLPFTTSMASSTTTAPVGPTSSSANSSPVLGNTALAPLTLPFQRMGIHPAGPRVSILSTESTSRMEVLRTSSTGGSSVSDSGAEDEDDSGVRSDERSISFQSEHSGNYNDIEEEDEDESSEEEDEIDAWLARGVPTE